MIRLAVLALALGGCAAYGMPRSTPAQGQSEATMARDRSACEDVAKTEVRARQPARPGAGATAAERVPWVDRERARQRDAAFSACMKDRGYHVEPAP